MEYIASLVWIVLEIICLYFSCKAFFQQRQNNKITLSLLLLAGILIFAIGNFNISPFSAYPFIKKATYLLICLLISFVAFSGPWYAHLALITLYYFALGAMDTLMIYGTAAVLGIPVSALIWKKWLYIVVVSIGKCILLFINWSIFYFRGRKNAPALNNKKFILTALFPLVSIVMLYIVFDSYKAAEDLSISAVIFSVILAAANFTIIYLMNSLDRAAQAEQEVAILNQSMALQTENIKALEKSYRAQRSATHEFKHQLQVISDLLENGNTAAAKDYISQLQITQTSRIFVANTGHAIVDAILNEKYHLAKENDIDISFKVNDLSALPIGTDAIVVLLSNLLDNAIEACQRLHGNRRIECTILMEDNLFLSIRNTSPPINMTNGELETVKEPKREHGFGLAGVRRVLKQLGGEYAIDFAEDQFQFVAEIPIE